jgi:hypothetical protein
MSATVIPLFPPGVHDIVTEDTPIESIKRVSCAMGDWGPIYAHETGVRWAHSAGYLHAAKHRRVPCHDECEVDCGYEGPDA